MWARKSSSSAISRAAEARRAWVRGAAVLAAIACLLPVAAAADGYDPQKAGHPVRILAYVAHPIGVVLDVLIFRPAHWLGSRAGLDEFFGHEPYDD